jgi:hypothetical protein
MERNNNILYLTSTELENMKKIGSGTDGSVYLYNNDLLVKIYHKKQTYFTSRSSKNDDDIKIYDKSAKNFNNPYKDNLSYYSYNDEDIKLRPKEAIFKAIDRQKNIELTALPVGAVYLDGRFAGCLLKRQKGIQVHKLMGLPLNTRKKIYLNILKENAELLKNNIYHCDLSNSPFVEKQVILPDKSILTKGHSHVLVNPLTLKTNFIDLDGKSTVYTERENKKYTRQNAYELNILALEFLLKIDYEEYREDTTELYYELESSNISSAFKDKLVSHDMTMNDLEEMTLKLTK